MNHNSYLFEVYHTKNYQRDFMIFMKILQEKWKEEECLECCEANYHLLYMTLFQMIMLFIINASDYGFVEYAECTDYGMQNNRMQNMGFPLHAYRN